MQVTRLNDNDTHKVSFLTQAVDRHHKEPKINLIFETNFPERKQKQ